MVEIGTRIRIIKMVGEPYYQGKVGIVELIDGIGQLHGTWGGCAIVPDKDEFEILRNLRTNFIRKPIGDEITPKHEFIIVKTIIISNQELMRVINEPMDEYEFILENKHLMYVEDNIWHVLAVTSKNSEFVLLIESEGFGYCRYASIIYKKILE
ncbi:MAG: DUF4314 domain-containing protein [Erysipelotrichales bacterium]|nr:DUF4314 domain-containing protein [Erysipelotrichales bacterium]